MPSKLVTYTLDSGNADGSGDATATTTKSIRGKILAIHLEYASASAAGTDVQIETSGTSDTAQVLLNIDDNNTSGWYYPRKAVEDVTGTGVTYDGTNEIYEPFIVNDLAKITVAQQTEGKNVVAKILVEEY